MAVEEYRSAVEELLRGVKYMVDEAIKMQTQVYNGIFLGNNQIQLNGQIYQLPKYGNISTPTNGSIVKVIVPNGNMSMAFYI